MRHYHRIKSIYPGFANIELTLLNLADLIIVIFFTTATIKLRDVVYYKFVFCMLTSNFWSFAERGIESVDIIGVSVLTETRYLRRK